MAEQTQPAKVKKGAKKAFFEVKAPMTASKIQLYAASPDELEGKIVKLDLTRSLKGKNFELSLKVKKTAEGLEGEPVGLELMGSYIRRMMRTGIDYVEDSCRTWANIAGNFKPGEVYNVGGRPEWEMAIEEYSDMVLKAVGADKKLVSYKEAEPFTTKVKRMDFSKSAKELGHDPKVPPEEGIKKTVEWMRWYYRIGD